MHRGFISTPTAVARLLLPVLLLLPVQAARAVAVPLQIPSDLVVTTAANSGAGSFREALDVINTPSQPGQPFPKTTILFDIPGVGPHVISLVTNLPALTGNAKTIDGYSQPGAVQATANTSASPQIVLDASGLSRGLRVEGDGNRVSGLVIQHADSGVGNGLILVGHRNVVSGNYIGLSANGEVAAPNTGDGVHVQGSDNVVGGALSGDRNVISGNDGNGILLSGDGNVVTGNRIGTDDDGVVDRGNDGSGVLVQGDRSQIGGQTVAQRNLISGNRGDGVRIASGNDVRVIGNLIGTTRSGSAPLGNGSAFFSAGGVEVETDGVVVSGNVIADNEGPGIAIEGDGAVVQDNTIGIDRSGTVAMGNHDGGVHLDGDDGIIGGVNHGNVIAANDGDGIWLKLGLGPNKGTAILGNLIGTTSSGAAVGNDGHGIVVQADDVRIGGVLPGERNVVSGNVRTGLTMSGHGGRVRGNLVGVDPTGTLPLPNLNEGMELHGDQTLVEGNTVANNGSDGIFVGPGAGHALIKNRIFENGGLGVDLGVDGVLPNDVGDLDVGENDLMNHPEIISAISSASGASVVWGIEDGLADTRFRVEIFTNDSCDQSGSGEARRLVHATEVVTDASGDAIQATTVSVPVGQWLATSATLVRSSADLGSTSELSPCVEVK